MYFIANESAYNVLACRYFNAIGMASYALLTKRRTERDVFLERTLETQEMEAEVEVSFLTCLNDLGGTILLGLELFYGSRRFCFINKVGEKPADCPQSQKP